MEILHWKDAIEKKENFEKYGRVVLAP